MLLFLENSFYFYKLFMFRSFFLFALSRAYPARHRNQAKRILETPQTTRHEYGISDASTTRRQLKALVHNACPPEYRHQW